MMNLIISKIFKKCNKLMNANNWKICMYVYMLLSCARVLLIVTRAVLPFNTLSICGFHYWTDTFLSSVIGADGRVSHMNSSIPYAHCLLVADPWQSGCARRWHNRDARRATHRARRCWGWRWRLRRRRWLRQRPHGWIRDVRSQWEWGRLWSSAVQSQLDGRGGLGKWVRVSLFIFP